MEGSQKQLEHSERWEETNADGLKESFPSSFFLLLIYFFVNWQFVAQ